MILYLQLLFWLAVAHAFTDYAWQTEVIAKYKNPNYLDPEGRKHLGPWWWTMGAHGLINGGGVALVTGLWWLGVAEVVVHTSTDTLKCNGRVGVYGDQAVHALSKLLWAGITCVNMSQLPTN